MRLAILVSALFLVWALTQSPSDSFAANRSGVLATTSVATAVAATESARADTARTNGAAQTATPLALSEVPSANRSSGATAGGFVAVPLLLADNDLYDLGVVDLNYDGWLDIFTTNHSDLQSLLVNQGGASFQDRLTKVRLDQNRDFPGWENSAGTPTLDAPGLYVYRSGNEFIVEWKAESPEDSVSGQLQLLTYVTLGEQTNVNVAVTEEAHPSAPVLTRVEFSATGDARLAVGVATPSLALPLTVVVGDDLPLSRIFVGPNEVKPNDHTFTLLLRDRHGMAWASFDGDDAIEVFIARGALDGMSGYSGVLEDELQQRHNLPFHDAIATSGIEKGSCRGREVRWIDLDRDGLLDLFLACQEGTPRFWHQESNSQFTDVSDVMAADGVSASAVLWVDVDGDLTAELVTVELGKLTVWEHDGIGPLTVRQTLMPPFNIKAPRVIVMADYDNDGDPDLLLSSEKNNTLFVNEGGTFVAIRGTSIGLPETSVTANWVDYDNDGLVDIHMIPDGIFRQQTDHTFVSVPFPELQFTWPLKLGRATWFDYDNDGARDVLAHAKKPSFIEHRFLRNEEATGHWLEVDLTYARGNRQAIGALVQVVSASRTQTQWVGQSEGSHFSQGHYRLYFGLGDDPVADSVLVTWPDGSTQDLGRSAGDELVQIARSSGSVASGDSALPASLAVSTETPGTHVLTRAYPNPFNPESQFSLSVERRQSVDVALFNSLGQRVATLFAGSMDAGTAQQISINGSNMASGIYLVRVVGETFTETMSVTLLK